MRAYLQDFIYQILLQKRRISYRELSDICKVSLPTVRKVVAELEKKSLVSMIYGGVELSSTDHSVVQETELIKEHHAIAKEAIKLIKDGEAIFLGPGKTVAALCQYLKPFNNLTVFTNSVYVIEQLSTFSNINLISLGGVLQHINMAFAPLEEELPPHIYISKCFISGAGINPEAGIFHSVPVNRQTEERVVEKSKEVILLVDKHKFGQEKAFVLMPIDNIDILVTTEGLSPEIINMLVKRGLDVRMAPL